MTWTPEREKLLTVLWTQGLSANQIAKQLGGVSRNAVIGKRIRMGLPDRKLTKSYRTGKPRAPHPRSVLSVPRFTAEPVREPCAPCSKHKVRFIDRTMDQCPMFCADQSGSEGFVCGNPIERGGYCLACAQIAYESGKAA